MPFRLIQSEGRTEPQRPGILKGVSAIVIMLGFLGCDGEGDVSLPKESRARITQDAAADGSVTPFKTKRGKTATGLKTIKTLMEGKDKGKD